MKPATFDTAISAAKPRRPRPRGSHRRDALDVYLDRARDYRRLSAEEERAQLVHLVELRRKRWEAVLSEPALLPALLRRIEASLDERAEPLERLEAVIAGPDDERRAVAVTLAELLEQHDANGELVEALAHDAPRAELPEAERDAYAQRVSRAMAEYCRARNRFVCANLRLVVKVADRYSGRWMSLADRVQEGNLGLLRAVERFDPQRGTRFSTYAVWWIRHAITRALVNRGRTVRVPAHLHVVFTKLRGVRASLEAELGRPATLPELAKRAEVPLDKAVAAVEAMELRSVSLEGPSDDEEGPAFPEHLGVGAPQAQIDAALDDRRNEALALRALQGLDPRERDIIEQRFALAGRPRVTLEALGRCYELSRERVRQLQNRALLTLRREVESSPVSGLAFA
ncbi:MAG: RNA polymerase sigma factor RpoD/SigA [Myxococcales bacterium]|nr:RNA polymerase sigma factor RpoD/SigA [Myxococcales bacterium]